MRVQIVKSLNSNNGSSDAQFAAGVIAAANSQPTPKLMSLSLINYSNNGSNNDAIRFARDKGIIVISCAGNGGIGNADSQFPSNTTDTISIGATDINNSRASFSGTGSFLEFVAPGANVRGLRWNDTGGELDTVNGCSFATPISAGIAGLMLAVNPSLTQEQIREAWRATARDQIGDVNDTPGRDDFYGWGLLDAAVVDGSGLQNLDVLSNDDGAGLLITAVSGGRGDVSIAADGLSVNYTPPGGSGTDDFTYTITSSQGGTDTATVSISLIASPDVQANPDSFTTQQNSPARAIDVLANDLGANLVIDSVTQGDQGGTVSNSGSAVSYAPQFGFSGTETFQYTISGLSGGPSTATVTVTVESPDPYCKSGSTGEGAITSVRFGNFSKNSGSGTNTDPALGPPGYSDFTDEVINLSPESTVAYEIISSGGAYKVWIDFDQDSAFNSGNELVIARGLFGESISGSFAVPAGAAGISRLRVSVKANNFQSSDGCEIFSQAGEVEDYSVNFGGPLDLPPVASDDAATVDTDSQQNRIPVTANDTLNGATISDVSAGDQGGQTVVSGNAVLYTPVAGFEGSEFFSYTLSNGVGTDSARVQVTVKAGDPLPVANDDALTVAQNSAETVIPVTGNDTLNGASLTVVTPPDNGGSATISGNTVLYRPATGFFGTETFNYTLTNTAGSADATVAVTVEAAGQFPISEDFSSGPAGFVFMDDAFRDTKEPDFADGRWVQNSGNPAPGLKVALGGVNNKVIFGHSGGWSREFSLTSATEVVLSFSYNMTLAANYDANEFSQVLASIDGRLVSPSGKFIAKLIGDGDGGPAKSTGNQTVSIKLGLLQPGVHTVAIGGFSNRKTTSSDVTTIVIDNVSVTDGSAGQPQFSIADISLSEAAENPGILVNLSQAVAQSVSVGIHDRSVQSATKGADYYGFTKTVVFAPGETSKNVALEFLDDAIVEANETFKLRLFNPKGASIGQDIATVTILDDDKPATRPQLSVLDRTVGEAEGSASITVSLSKAAATDVPMFVFTRADGGATPGSDYYGMTTRLTIPKGQTSATVSVTILDDSQIEATETLSVRVVKVTGADVLRPAGTVTIQDND